MGRLEVRRTMALAEARELDGMVALALSWWEALRPAPGALPDSLGQLPVPLSRLVSSAALISVARLSPARFQFSLIDAMGSEDDDLAALWLAPARLRELRKAFYDELNFSAFSGSPTYRLNEVCIGAEAHGITRRLILPLAAGGSAVNQLLVLSDLGVLENREEFGYAAL